MRWNKARRSDNVVDVRGGRGRGGGGAKVGIGGLLLALVLGWVFGVDPAQLLSLVDGGGKAVTPTSGSAPPANDAQAEFVRAILGDTEDAWGELFRAGNAQYPVPKLVLFEGSVRSACGMASSATGPFYCPADSQVYLDLQFFRELETRFKAEGDFARAYVIAHEVGHHVQNVIGVFQQTAEAERRGASRKGAEGLSVRQELQADCFAGVWANHAQRRLNWLEPGDIDEALNAASVIGDDHLQRQAQGYVVPESCSHGTSEQRRRWFRLGFERGDMSACDALRASRL